MIMEILSNFSSAYCFISFIFGALFMLAILRIAAMGKVRKPINKVHFYVARDNDDELWLYIGKPYRGDNVFCACFDKGVITLTNNNFKNFGLYKTDYVNLKWEDEPVEVFLNMDD